MAPFPLPDPRNMAIFPRSGLMLPVDGGGFVAKNAVVTGEVIMGEDVGVWFGCVVRGDDAPLSIGSRTNIQDLTMIHADPGVPNLIGDSVRRHPALVPGHLQQAAFDHRVGMS